MHLKVLFGKWWSFCLSLNVLNFSNTIPIGLDEGIVLTVCVIAGTEMINSSTSGDAI